MGDIGVDGGNMAVMAKEPQKQRGRPKGEPTTAIHTTIRVSVAKALRRYIESKPDGAKLNRIVERGLIAILTEEGFWPLPNTR